MFALPMRPMRIILDGALAASQVMPVTRPWPVFRPGYKAAMHRIAVHVAQLFRWLVFGPNIEVVVARLPKARLVWALSFFEAFCQHRIATASVFRSGSVINR